MKLFGRNKQKEKSQINENLSTNEEIQLVTDDVVNQSKMRTQASNLVTKMDKRKLDYKSNAECEVCVAEACETIVMAQKQLTESKIEYGAVTSYLTDIQKIDQIAIEEKERLSHAARQIVNLTEERNRIQNREIRISDFMYKHLEKYENQIPDEINKMKQNEEYFTLIKEDLRQLEGEKAVLLYDEEELNQKHSYIKKVTVVTMILVLTLFAVFYWFEHMLEMNVRSLFLITIGLTAIGAYFIFAETMKTNKEIRQNRLKLNRAIGLLNKVKIKYVNNQNNLDYTYQKFRVHDSKELMYLWEQYVRVKDENRRYQQNTELLEYYNNVLMDELDRFQVEDVEVWIYQPLALIDNKEMVEVRHRLNLRRQKLREQIDYNNSIVVNAKNEIADILDKNPQSKELVVTTLSKYKLEKEFLRRNFED